MALELPGYAYTSACITEFFNNGMHMALSKGGDITMSVLHDFGKSAALQ